MDANNELLQAIGQILDDKLTAALEPIRGDIASVQQGQAELKQDVRELNQRVAVVESKVLHELGIIKEGITGWQERNRQIDRPEDTVDNHATAYGRWNKNQKQYKI